MKDLLHSSAWMKDEGRRTKDLLPSDLSFQSLYYLVFYPLAFSEQSERSFIFLRSGLVSYFMPNSFFTAGIASNAVSEI